jgi:hypothetical protein
MTQDSNIPISCAEFQDHLPDFFVNANGLPDDASLQHHLDTCDNCSTLVRDLQYIADQARLLLEPAEEDPSDAVWSNIQSKMEQERAEAGNVAPPMPR